MAWPRNAKRVCDSSRRSQHPPLHRPGNGVFGPGKPRLPDVPGANGHTDPSSRELVIDRVLALDANDVDIEQLKWVLLMVLFNEPGQEAAYAWMEDLVFDNIASTLH